jgi:hypothetical protein
MAYRRVARAKALGDDIDRLVSTNLDALIKLTMPERKELIERTVLDVKSKKSCFTFQFMPSKLRLRKAVASSIHHCVHAHGP